MSKVMNPSGLVTEGQVEKINQLLGHAIHKAMLSRTQIQAVLEVEGVALASDMVEMLRRRVDAMGDTIVRCVTATTDRSVEEILCIKKEAWFQNTPLVKEFLASLPLRASGTVEVFFFQVPPRFRNHDDLERMKRAFGSAMSQEEILREWMKPDYGISPDQLRREYEVRGLQPVDPCVVALLNVEDPSFAEDHSSQCVYGEELDQVVFFDCDGPYVYPKATRLWVHREFAGVRK